MYNKVTLMGRICHDLELKSTPNGISVLSFRIAVERNFQPKKDEKKADFFNIVAWRGTAEFISKCFSKGRLILIDGEMQTRQYIDKDNFTRTVVEVLADKVYFTGEPKPQAASQTEEQEFLNTSNTDNSQEYAQEEIKYTDEDYPF